jgi:hypothetical protein
VAAQNNHEALASVNRWFSQSVSFVIGHLALMGRSIHRAGVAQLCQDEADKATIVRLLAQADLGIADVSIEDAPLPELSRKAVELIGAQLPHGTSRPETAATHRVIRLLHRVGARLAPFEAEQESSGTLAYLALLGPLVNLLKNGGVLLVDELDTSLHPLMALQIMRLFSDPASNPHSAQLVFNTHDTNLLRSGEIRRDQIWFTEKDSTGTSHLYPLTDFKPRRQENLENGYLQGRYGAIPFIHPDYLTGNAGGNGEKS